MSFTFFVGNPVTYFFMLSEIGQPILVEIIIIIITLLQNVFQEIMNACCLNFDSGERLMQIHFRKLLLEDLVHFK